MDDGQRTLPTSELDLNMMLTNAVWGRPEVSTELKDRLMKHYSKEGADGEIIITSGSLWGLLGFYTRDMRLANLSDWNGELQSCRYMIDLANDYLSENMIEPFIISLSRAVNIMETSQSKHGFLRKQMNTITQKHQTQNMDPPKKHFFGGSKDKQNGGGY